jgi:hypothetical protein
MQIKNTPDDLKNNKVKIPINFSFEFDLNLLNNQEKLLKNLNFLSFKDLMENEIKKEITSNFEENNINKNNEDNNIYDLENEEENEYEEIEIEEENLKNINYTNNNNKKDEEMNIKIKVTFVNLLLIIMFYILNKFHL